MSLSSAIRCGGRVPGNQEVARMGLCAERAAHKKEGSEATLSDAVER